MRARYYDPALGRFLQEDPLGIGGGLNPYAFGGGDPVNMRDPSGMGPCITFMSLPGPLVNGVLQSPPEYSTICFDDPPGGGMAWTAAPSGAASGGLGRGPTTPAKPKQSAECSEAQLNLGIIAVGDAAFLLGAGPAAEWISAGAKAERAAEFYSTTARYMNTNRAALARAGRNAAYSVAAYQVSTAAGGYVSGAGMHTMLSQGPENVSWKDLIPVWASFRAYRQLRSACSK